jgi:uncharacterized Rossmann fold enzyme
MREPMRELGVAGDQPSYLAAHLQELLARDPRVNEPELDVTIEGERIRVDGVVPTVERREAVAVVLEEACPDLPVDNRTTVADYEPPAEGERIS